MPFPGANRQFRKQGVVVLCVVFVLSRVVVFLAGVRMRGDLGTPQLLDPQALEHDFLSSLWHLHSFPPMLNIFVGVLLQFPERMQMTLAHVCSMVLGLTIVLTTFFFSLELGLRRLFCIGIPLLVILGPDYILFENFLFYTYATTAFMMLAALFLLRHVRDGTSWSGFAYILALAALVWTNSTYQWPWFVLGLVPLVLASPREWSRLLKIAIVPVLLVAVWYGKNVVLFRTFSTSSTAGMNLAKPVLLNAPDDEVRAMIDKGQLHPVAAVYPFDPLDHYVPWFIAQHQPRGVPVLDDRTKSPAGFGNPNYNNLDYIKVSNLYMTADLKFLKKHPLVLIQSAWKALQNFDLPADQYYVVGFDQRPKIQTYANLYDRWVLLQINPMLDANFSYEAWSGRTPNRTQASWTRAFVFGATLFVLPFALWRRRPDRAVLWALIFVMTTTWYTVVVTSFFDLGENNRFSFNLGSLPMLGCAYALSQFEALRRISPRRPRLRQG